MERIRFSRVVTMAIRRKLMLFVILLFYTLIIIYFTSHSGDYEVSIKTGDNIGEYGNGEKIRKLSLYDKIPKLFHYIWISSTLDTTNHSNLDQGILKNIKTCQDTHSDWEIKVWTDDLVRKEFPDLINRLLETGVEGVITDVLRYYILASYGGIYMDVDFICIRNFAPLLQNQFCNAFISSEDAETDNQPDTAVSVGMVGATPGHIILERAVINVVASAQRPGTTTKRTGSQFFKKMIRRYNTQYDCIYVYSKKGFYNCGYQERNSCDISYNAYKKDSNIYAMHLW